MVYYEFPKRIYHPQFCPAGITVQDAKTEGMVRSAWASKEEPPEEPFVEPEPHEAEPEMRPRRSRRGD